MDRHAQTEICDGNRCTPTSRQTERQHLHSKQLQLVSVKTLVHTKPWDGMGMGPERDGMGPGRDGTGTGVRVGLLFATIQQLYKSLFAVLLQALQLVYAPLSLGSVYLDR